MVILRRRTDTEVFLADLTRAVQDEGHQPLVYTPSAGEVAAVVTDLARLPARPDVIHGHHHLETVEALRRFPQTPALFVCHDMNAGMTRWRTTPTSGGSWPWV